MQLKFEDFGITGISNNGVVEQRTLCPRCSAHRKKKYDKCLAVNLEKGTWFCHNCSWSGSLNLREEKKFIPKPVQTKAIEPSDNAYLWFAKRGIPREVIDRNKITLENIFLTQSNKNERCICFNYFVNDTLVNIKYRSPQKHFQQVKGGQKVFYKLNDILEETKCIITEGEIDALSFEVAGYKYAVSVPDGAINPNAKNITTKLEYLDNCAEYFNNKTKIYLATDTDAPGIRLREELARRLGKSKCWIVKYPQDCKDANDVLMKFGKKELKQCIENAEQYPIEGVHLAISRFDELKNLYENGIPNGANTGYKKFDDLFTFYGSQLTVVTGIPNHGKTNFVDQLMLKLAIRHDWKFAVFSPENATIEIHLIRLCEILVGKPLLPNYNNQMTPAELNSAVEFINEHIFFILPDNVVDFKLEKILNSTSELVLRKGVKALIIDPWNTIEHQKERGEVTTDYIGRVLNQVKYFSRTHDLHTIIVAHPTKIKKQAKDPELFEVPTLYDISGSANWYNVVDNGISVYRQFTKEQGISYTKVYLQKVKHKYIGRIGYAKFDFDISCQRYNEKDTSNKKQNELDDYVELAADGYPKEFDNNITEDEPAF